MKIPNEFDSSLYTAKLRRMGREETMSTDDQVRAMGMAPEPKPNVERKINLNAEMMPPMRREA